MRLFAALALPEDVIAHLFSLRLRLSDARDGLRWSTPEQWHITLQFFGDINQAEVEDLEKALTNLSLVAPEVVLEGLGLFSAKGILYAAVEASPALKALQQQVAEKGAACHAASSPQVFHPHVTLARSKGKTGDRKLRQLTQPQMPSFGPPLRWLAKEYWLIESTLGPTGAVYESRQRFPLQATPPDRSGESSLGPQRLRTDRVQ